MQQGWCWQDLIQSDLLIGHPVDNAVISRVHVPQVVSNGDDCEGQSDHQPQHNVEDHSVLKVVLVGQVVGAARVTLEIVNPVKQVKHKAYVDTFI